MTKKQIERTRWAKKFKRNCLKSSYVKAINFALSGCEFDIADVSNYNCTKIFAVVPTDDLNFWMEEFKTKTAAIIFCKKMGWRLAK